MAYAPKSKKYKIKWRIATPLLVLVALLVYAGISIYIDKTKKAEPNFTICGLDREKSIALINKKIANTMYIEDYVIYGESLGLFDKAYSPLNEDPLSGKTIVLNNLCTGKETSLTMEGYIDQKIALDELKKGFYDVSIIDNLVKKRIVFKEPSTQNAFQSVARKGKVNAISIIGDVDLLKDYNIKLDKNYMFIQVDEKNANKSEIDVLLDPYGLNKDLTQVPDPGWNANGLEEKKEMYDAAVLMKKELESYGLRVAISKDNAQQTGQAYGKDGRLAKGYEQKAKYYVFMRFNNSDNASIKGVEIYHSAYASATLARTLMYGLQKDMNMKGSNVYATDPSIDGVGKGLLIKGLDDNEPIYDSNLYLRESGGRATLAGKFSENSKKENASFANANGMNGVEIDFAYISNKDDAAFWKKNKAKIIAQTAKSFAKGINVLKD